MSSQAQLQQHLHWLTLNWKCFNLHDIFVVCKHCKLISKISWINKFESETPSSRLLHGFNNFVTRLFPPPLVQFAKQAFLLGTILSRNSRVNLGYAHFLTIPIGYSNFATNQNALKLLYHKGVRDSSMVLSVPIILRLRVQILSTHLGFFQFVLLKL